MNNRILGCLILLGCGAALYAAYIYIYVYSPGSLLLTSNHAPYSLTLESETVKRSFHVSCNESNCIIPDLPAVSYALLARTDGFHDINMDIKIAKNTPLELRLSFQKNIELIPITESSKSSLSPRRKASLFTTHKLYRLIENASGIYLIKKEQQNLEITSLTGNIIGSFDFDGVKKDIEITAVSGNDDMIWIRIGNQYWIYSNTYQQLRPLEAITDIVYIKQISPSKFEIITQDGFYEYIFHTQSLSVIDGSYDCVRSDTGQDICLVHTDDSTNIISGDTILLESGQTLTHIYKKDDLIHIQDSLGNTFILK